MTTIQIVILVVILVVVLALAVVGVIWFMKHRNSKPAVSTKKEPVVQSVKKEVKPVEEPKPVELPKEEIVEDIVEDDDKEEDFQKEEEPEKVVQVVNGRKVFVQYNYSFKAKLILSTPEVQKQYRDLIHYVRQYGVKTSLSWKQERIYLGRNTYAMLVFKGKKLCVAYALDPKEYEETKYRLIDLSEVKRFVKTPALIKLSSERKQKYSYELLDILFAKNNLEKKEVEEIAIDIPTRTKDELIEDNLIKVYTSDEVTEGAVLEQANVGDIIRKNVTITEAKQLITDDSALEYVQVETNTKKKTYSKKDIINLDTLSKSFAADELVNLETLKEKKLIAPKVDYIKVLARGVLDKPLIVEAQDYSIDAIKMIVITGGEVRKVN